MTETSASRPTRSPAAAAPPTAGEIAAHLRTTVSALVRGTRAVDQLAPAPASVLDLLDRRGPMTTADLAASRQVRHQTMAVIVKELTNAGFLDTEADPADARKKILTLTAAGQAALDADRRLRLAALAEAVDEALDEDERRDLARALDLIDRITRSVGRVSRPPQAGPAATGPITGAW